MRGARRLKAGDVRKKAAITKAIDIILNLRASLNLEEGGNLTLWTPADYGEGACCT